MKKEYDFSKMKEAENPLKDKKVSIGINLSAAIGGASDGSDIGAYQYSQALPEGSSPKEPKNLRVD